VRTLVPPDLSHDTLRRFLPEGAAQLTARTLTGDHDFQLPSSLGVPVYHPAYFGTLLTWAREDSTLPVRNRARGSVIDGGVTDRDPTRYPE
jgi:hypothetical protein